MLTNYLTLLAFPLIGIAWRYLKPGGTSADSLQRGLMALIQKVLLPLVVLISLLELSMNATTLKIMLYVMGATLLALVLAWFVFLKSKLPAKTRGALIISSAFSGAMFLGIPVNNIFYPDWTIRVAVEFGLVANVLMLFTFGAVVSNSLTDSGKPKFSKALTVLKDYNIWIKEPLVWATMLGLILNISGVALPGELKGVRASLFGALLPLLLLTMGLSLHWSKEWNSQIVKVLPAVAIQLIALPLLMWLMASLFGSVGAKTTQVLLLDAMLPASLLGFAFCERFKLDSTAYAQTLVAGTALSLLTVPLMAKVLF